MSFNRFRSDGSHRNETNQRRESQRANDPWRHYHRPSNSISPSFSQHLTARGPPVQSLQSEANRSSRYDEFGGSDGSRFDCGPGFHHRADNGGYSSAYDQSHRHLSTTTASGGINRAPDFRYPPVQSLQSEARPRLYTEFDGSDRSSFDHVNVGVCQPVHRPDNRGYPSAQSSFKRMETDFGYFPSSRPLPPPQARSPRFTTPTPVHPPKVDDPDRKVAASSSVGDLHVRQRSRTSKSPEGLPAVVSEEKNFHDDSSTTSSTKNEHPRILALPEDKSHLTALHCYVRRHCVYIFCAESHEVDVPRKGRKKPLTFGQIGIGCVYCKESATKLKGCSYFPSSISGIYNATMIIQQRHFPVCPSVTKEVYMEYNKLKGLTARSASTKEYWISSAKKLGMVDTNDGVFFRSMCIENGDKKASPQGKTPKSDHCMEVVAKIDHKTPFCSLVEPGDRAFATEYAYFVMAQMTTTTFTESDRLGKRKGHVVGFPGLACKYCYGGNGSGRFFPLTLKTFSDVSKSLHVLRNHLVKCAEAPAGLSEKVSMLHEQHQNDKGTTPFGSQKIFFDHVWRRLHPEMYDGTGKANLKHPPQRKKRKTSPTEEVDKVQSESFETNDTEPQDAAPFELHHKGTEYKTSFSDSVQMPPLPPPQETTASFSIANQSDSHESGAADCQYDIKHRGPAKKRYLSLHYHGNPEPYSEADVSVAMILATGMGRQTEQSEDTPSEMER